MTYRIIRYCLFLLPVLVCVLDADASWQIDPERYHVSVHGQTLCTECHQDASDTQAHPDPANVNKSVSDFFSAETCSDCHESVEDYVDAGEHGGKAIESTRDIENCLACHNPHYDMGSDVPDRFDSNVSAKDQCNACHEEQAHLPSSDSDDKPCMACHTELKNNAGGAVNVSAFCLHCHGDVDGGRFTASFPRIDGRSFLPLAHGDISCLSCHTRAAEYMHGNQPETNCRQCHKRHDEGTAHDAHINISCQACHGGDGMAEKDPETGRVTRTGGSLSGPASRVHEMTIDDERSCTRCHYPGNDLGAAGMVLPAKSLICMPCHTATFSVGDTVTLSSLFIFILGMLSLIYGLLAGRMGDAPESTRMGNLMLVIRNAGGALFSSRVVIIARTLFIDGLCQRPLFTRSPSRWAIHALIFYPFVIRFSWGICALFLSKLFPDLDMTRELLDKNNSIGALLFDVTGLMVILGACLAVVMKKERPAEGFIKMPGHDWIASALLLSIVLVGFILEGMRIAMTGFPVGSQWAFGGNGLAVLFSGTTGIADIYGYVWYAHAVFTGLFVAYLPFSRMLHMITAPVVMAMNRLEKEKEHN
jgi:nitrate reductase gamma subunit